MGAKTLSELDKSIGDTVRVRTSRAERVYVIVGRAVLPTFDRAVPLADGAIFTGAGYAPLFDRDSIYHRQFVGVFAPGAAPAEVLRQIDALDELGTPATPAQPVEIAWMEELRGLANVMIVILCALATIAIAHALVTTVRRRRRELAVLKTLGFVRGQVRGTVACQAGTLTLVGLVVGVPAGILVGRFAWRLVTDALGVASSRNSAWSRSCFSYRLRWWQYSSWRISPRALPAAHVLPRRSVRNSHLERRRRFH